MACSLTLDGRWYWKRCRTGWCHKGPIWTYVVSLWREDVSRIGYDNAERRMALLRFKRAMLCKYMKINNANLRCFIKRGIIPICISWSTLQRITMAILPRNPLSPCAWSWPRYLPSGLHTSLRRTESGPFKIKNRDRRCDERADRCLAIRHTVQSGD